MLDPARLPSGQPDSDDILLELGGRVYGIAVVDWRQSRVIAGTIVSLFIVVQLAIPLPRLYQERGQRFGWQMYSATNRPTPEFAIDTDDGQISIDPVDYLPTSRIEVDVIVYLPSHLCEVIPGAKAVSWNDEIHQC